MWQTDQRCLCVHHVAHNLGHRNHGFLEFRICETRGMQIQSRHRCTVYFRIHPDVVRSDIFPALERVYSCVSQSSHSTPTIPLPHHSVTTMDLYRPHVHHPVRKIDGVSDRTRITWNLAHTLAALRGARNICSDDTIFSLARGQVFCLPSTTGELSTLQETSAATDVSLDSQRMGHIGSSDTREKQLQLAEERIARLLHSVFRSYLHTR